MPISTTNALSGPFATNGSTTAFPFTFTAPSASEVQVVLRNTTTGVETIASSGDYTVALTSGGGGTVTFASAPATGSHLFILLNPLLTQDIEFATGSKIQETSLNEVADDSVARDQFLKGLIDRAPKTRIGETGPVFTSLPDLVGETLGLQSDGNGGYQIIPGVAGALAGVVEVTDGSFTLSANHAFNVLKVNHGSNLTVTIPSGLLDIGAYVELYQAGFGRFTIAGASGVTVRSRGNLFQSAGTNAIVGVRKIGVDEWVVAGDVS